MLTKKQIDEIKEHLHKAQNPLFFFDNDADGLCSFLLLQRYLGRGKGVAVKSFPDMDAGYFRKVHELDADYIFILDKPLVSKGFFEEVEKHNIPVVWIDHHLIDMAGIPDFVNYYNPLLNKKSILGKFSHKPKTGEPVTALCYQITKREEDLWLAVIGCVSDKFTPKFYKEFEKKYPELSIKSKDAFDIFYKSEIGRIAKIFAFALKDRTTNVVSMIKFLIKVKNPYEILEENSANKLMHSRFEQINSKYQKYLSRAVETGKNSGKLLFFKYSGDLSISSDLSNELHYLFPKKIIVVLYLAASKINISVRGKNSRKILLQSIENLEGATGGGHPDAAGATIATKDLEKFKENFEKLVTS